MSTESEEKTENGDAVVQAALASIQSQKKSKGSRWRWILALIAGILSLVAVGVIYFQIWRKGREIAKLKHERDILREEERAAEAASHIAANTELMIEAMKEAEEAQERQASITNNIEYLREDTLEKRDVIDSLLTWEDVDLYLKK